MNEKTAQKIKIEDDMLNLFNIRFSNKGEFFAKVDALIVKSSATGSAQRIWVELKENWDLYLGKYSYVENDAYLEKVLTYLKEVKTYYLIYKNEGIEKIQSNFFILRLLSESGYILNILKCNDLLSAQDNFIRFLQEDLKLNENDLKIANKALDDMNKHYQLNKYGTEKIYSIFKSVQSELEKIYASVCNEYRRRNADATKIDEKEEVHAQNQAPNIEYGLLIQELEEKVNLLQEELIKKEKEIIDLSTYSIKRYNDGVKDTLKALNNRNIGAVLSRLYLFANDIENFEKEEVKIFIKNLFVALENIGVKAFEVEKLNQPIEITAKDIGIKFILDRDVVLKDVICGRVRFPGWSYKNEVFILPTINVENKE
ncbi:hypothetical protein [Caloramator australicus]|uniref:Uncharacterized protein n=1 Tax=Caloramator australicus RC3 TaxID=857293 RepID=I7KVQ0_9CLOT|nr:hypothetical protein [Caloramator australicus]CCJ34129.1 hypothetical protein CAAU_2045 [Caloramator australicus RC3]